MVEIYRNREPGGIVKVTDQDLQRCKETLLAIEEHDNDVTHRLNWTLQNFGYNPLEINGLGYTFKTLAASIATFNDKNRWKKTAYFMSGKHLYDLRNNKPSYYSPDKFNPDIGFSEEELGLMHNFVSRRMIQKGEYSMKKEELYAGLVAVSYLSENYIDRLLAE